MPKAFLLKKEKSITDDLTADLSQVDVGGVVTAQQNQVQMNGTGDPTVLQQDQQVPNGNFFYPYFYPQEYYSSYIPTLWTRHYQQDFPTSWSNYGQGGAPNDPATQQQQQQQQKNNAANNFMSNINLPSQSMNLQQMNNFGNFNAAPVANTLNNQAAAAAAANVGLSNFFPNSQQPDQFQQQFNQFLPQQTQQMQHHHHHQQQQALNQFGMPNQLAGQFDTDPNEKVKRDLYNEFFDLDNNGIKKETVPPMLLPNAVAAVLDSQVPRLRRRRIVDGGSETDSISSNDSNRSDHSSAAVVDSIINSGLEKGMGPMGRLNPNDMLSPKLEEGEKVFKCEFCNKKFTRSWNYQRHVLIHSGRKPHKCDVCNKAFVLAAHLKIHMRIHTGEKPYKCTVCGRGFAQLTNLQRHVLTHTGQKPHRCQHCNKGFVSSSDLRRHIRIHTGEKPYQCHACTKAFTTSGNLQSHILTHTGVKPYSCTICKWKFISSSNLRTHLRTHHCNTTNTTEQDTSSEQMVPDTNALNNPGAIAQGVPHVHNENLMMNFQHQSHM